MLFFRPVTLPCLLCFVFDLLTVIIAMLLQASAIVEEPTLTRARFNSWV